MIRFKLLVVALGLLVMASPSFAQWQTSEPASFEAQYPNGRLDVATGGPQDAMALIRSRQMRVQGTRLRATERK